MYRFLIFAWNRGDGDQQEAADALVHRLLAGTGGWIRVVDRRGVAAFHAGVRVDSSDAVLLDPEIDGSCPGSTGGVVFGTLFSAREVPFERVTSCLDMQASRSIIQSGGSRLLEDWWGRYVALLFSPGRVRVLRDPSGLLPCFHTAVRRVHLFFSCVDDVIALQAPAFSVNWNHVASFATRSASPRHETGLKEIGEVSPGECVELRAGSFHTIAAWDPAAVSSREPIDDVPEALRAIRETTRACVAAWASCYPAIVHSLSGGLDSSVVLDCLARTVPRPALTCLNYFGSGGDDDERSYARLSAARAHAELVECQLDPAGTGLDALFGIRRSPLLSSYIGALQRRPAEVALVAERGAQSIFSGAGGDGLFFQARAELAVADFVSRHGLRRRALRVALDAARITQRSALRLLLPGIRDGFSRRGARGIGPGKAWQIANLSSAPAFEDPLGSPDDPERTHPLLSQPLVEVCLRIPTYVLIDGGWDRAIARRAFADALPDAIVRRRGKGNINAFSNALLDRNRTFVREFLLDGLLVKGRILDRARLERSLSGHFPLSDCESSEILHTHVSAEAWARRW